jgi:Anti-sigma-K factor rskA
VVDQEVNMDNFESENVESGSSLHWPSSEIDNRIDAVLRDPSAWVEPPVAMRARVLADAAGLAGSATQGLSRLDARRRSTRMWLAPLGVAASLVAFVGWLGTRPAPRFDATSSLVALPAHVGSTGKVTMSETSSGWRFRLSTDQLPRLEKPYFYEAWIKGPKGEVSIGTFHTGVDVVLWGGVELDEYPNIVISKEIEDGNQAISNDIVLTGRVTFPTKN